MTKYLFVLSLLGMYVVSYVHVPIQHWYLSMSPEECRVRDVRCIDEQVLEVSLVPVSHSGLHFVRVHCDTPGDCLSLYDRLKKQDVVVPCLRHEGTSYSHAGARYTLSPHRMGGIDSLILWLCRIPEYVAIACVVALFLRGK